MTGPGTRGGFVYRAIEGVRGLFDDPPTGTAADYVPALTRRLFDDVLGYDDIAYSQHDDWETVTFVDDEGRPAVVLAATAPGDDVRAARRRAVTALDDEPSARYAVATNRDRLVVLARCGAGHPDAVERAGVVTREITDIDLRAAVERSTDRSLAAALTPDHQLSIATLTALQRESVGAALDDPAAVGAEPTLGDLTASAPTPETTPETLASALTETLTEVLHPAVSEAFEELTRRIQTFADREIDLQERIEAAKDAGDEMAVTDLRADLFDLREEFATARRLEAGFARWRRVVDDGSEADAADAFAAESAAVALDTLLLARVAADRGLAGDLAAAREFWGDESQHAKRDAADMVRAVREELSGVSEDTTADGTFGWVFEADAADAFAEAVDALDAVDVGALDAAELSEAFDRHLDADARPVRGATQPSTAGLLLDRAGYTADAAVDGADADLLDPACGDGSLLVGAADRLLARLGETDASPGETLSTVRDRLQGFDVHPYAVHLAESRLLLRTVDVHADAARADGAFSLGRFDVYRTDALGEERRGHFTSTAKSKRARRRERAAEAKDREDYRYVVSDVPTGRVSDQSGASDASENADSAHDRSALFLDRAGDWLVDGGRLSVAVDGSLLRDDDAAGARSRLADAFDLRELIEFDTGAGAMPLFVAAQRDAGVGPGSALTYARVTPTFLDLVREGLIRPGGDGETTPAELVSRALPETPGGEPPSMATVVVELDLVCDAVVDGSVPVEVRSVDADELADGPWAFAPAEAEAEAGADDADAVGDASGTDAALEAAIASLEDRETEGSAAGSPRSRME